MGYGTPFPLLGDYSLRLRELCERLNSDSVWGRLVWAQVTMYMY